MQKGFYFALFLLVGILAGCGDKPAASAPPPPVAVAPAPPELLFRAHFVGARQLVADTNAATLAAIGALPTAAELQGQALKKIAAAQIARFAGNTNAASPETLALLTPLFGDWWQNESFVELRGETNRPAEFTLAVRLDDEAAQRWQTNLWQLLTTLNLGTPAATNSDGFSGWEVPAAGSTPHLRMARAGEWLVAGWGPGALTTWAQTAARIKTGGRPVAAAEGYFLSAELNLPRLAPQLGWPEFFQGPPGQWPQVNLTVAARNDSVRTKARLLYAAPLPFALEPWQIPSNVLRDPLISFSAGQGLAPWLDRVGLIHQLDLKPLPNQFFFWAQEQPPVQLFTAFPVANPTNFLTQLGARLPGVVNDDLKNHGVGQALFLTNQTQVTWSGLLALVPNLRPAPGGENEFVAGWIFPGAPHTNPAPAGLLAQVAGRTNLVYYDWELAQLRVAQWRVIASLGEFASFNRRPGPNGPPAIFSPARLSSKFLTAMAPLLRKETEHGWEGETVTEVTLVGPRELAITRKSILGFTGVELVGLSWWLENPAFPGFSPEQFAGPAVKTSPLPGAGLPPAPVPAKP